MGRYPYPPARRPAMADPSDRRDFLLSAAAAATLAAAAGTASGGPVAGGAGAAPRSFLTNPPDFRDVSRGTPRPSTLQGEQLVRARLTPATWRLEIVSDGTTEIATPRTLAKDNAIDLAELE